MFKRLISLFVIAGISVFATGQWSTYHGDNQRTGRSAATGPLTPQIRWSVDLNGPIIGGPVIGPDGTVYTGSVWDETLKPRAYVNAINPDGTLKWKFETVFIDDQSFSTPALGPEGNLYVGSVEGVLYALNSSGQEIWRHQAFSPINSYPVVAPGGTVYVKVDGMLKAFSPAGNVLWRFAIGSTFPGSPTLDPYGTIYVPGATGLFALNPDGSQKWYTNLYFDSASSPVIAPTGNIIFANGGRVNSIDPSTGTVLWTAFEGSSPYSSPAVDTQGNIYVVDGWSLRKLNSSGQMQWETDFIYQVNRLESSWSAPIVDAAGRLYLGLGTGKRWAVESAKGIVIYDAQTGQKLNHFRLPETPSTSHPAMGPDGTIYIGCLDGKLYAIEE